VGILRSERAAQCNPRYKALLVAANDPTHPMTECRLLQERGMKKKGPQLNRAEGAKEDTILRQHVKIHCVVILIEAPTDRVGDGVV
jgi:hypothetical protein